jgi:hypothetical protein
MRQIPLLFTREQWLVELLRRFTRRGHAPNLTLLSGEAPPDLLLQLNDIPLAAVRAGDGREYVVTNQRLLCKGDTLVQYADLLACHWITDSPDVEERSRLKAVYFDRLILEGRGGRKVVLSQLGQAAFALLKFLGWVAAEAK